MTDTEAAYIAGILDGEGCISISRSNRPGGYLYYALCISVANTKKDLIDWLLATTGMGRVSCRAPTERAAQVYRWNVQSYNHVEFLNTIMPYLVIKRRQAELGLMFHTLGHGMLHDKDELYKQLVNLNSRGNFL